VCPASLVWPARGKKKQRLCSVDTYRDRLDWSDHGQALRSLPGFCCCPGFRHLVPASTARTSVPATRHTAVSLPTTDGHTGQPTLPLDDQLRHLRHGPANQGDTVSGSMTLVPVGSSAVMTISHQQRIRNRKPDDEQFSGVPGAAHVTAVLLFPRPSVVVMGGCNSCPSHPPLVRLVGTQNGGEPIPGTARGSREGCLCR
jgi:hypothetical protein